jgi:hypothetical protein
MTGLPEAKLAREAEMAYCQVSLVTGAPFLLACRDILPSRVALGLILVQIMTAGIPSTIL